MNEELRVAIDEQLRALHESYQLTENEAEKILARMIDNWLREPDAYDIDEWLSEIHEEEVEIMNDSELKMSKFKIGDKVRRNNNMKGANHISVLNMNNEMSYEVEKITSKGKLILANYPMLVDPDHVELSPQPIYGYYLVKLSGDGYYESVSPIFLSHNEVPSAGGINRVDYDVEKIEIDRTSLLNYIKENKL